VPNLSLLPRYLAVVAAAIVIQPVHARARLAQSHVAKLIEKLGVVWECERPDRRVFRLRPPHARHASRPDEAVTRLHAAALKATGITKPFRPWHDLRHTALTHEAAAGNPHAYVQAKAGHSQSTITDRYIHAAQVLFPGAAEKAEARMFRVAG
jgi:integrase